MDFQKRCGVLLFLCFYYLHSAWSEEFDCVDDPFFWRGTVSTTENGYTCQRWDSYEPNNHSYTSPNQFPDETLADAANYCRDPEGEGELWCYTTDDIVVWDFCDVPPCPRGPCNDSCGEDRFRCDNCDCIWSIFLCDGEDNCIDGSDEKDETCSETFVRPGCWKGEFRCNNGNCIWQNWVCDDNDDCGDNSDEYAGCTALKDPCNEASFKCSSGDCIWRRYVCDDDVDCFDESDENICTDETFFNLAHISAPPGKTGNGSTATPLPPFALGTTRTTIKTRPQLIKSTPQTSKPDLEIDMPFSPSEKRTKKILKSQTAKIQGSSASLASTSDSRSAPESTKTSKAAKPPKTSVRQGETKSEKLGSSSYTVTSSWTIFIAIFVLLFINN